MATCRRNMLHHCTAKNTKYSVRTQLFVRRGRQLHVSAKMYSHILADYENKKRESDAVNLFLLFS